MLRKHISTVRFSSYLHPKNTFHTKKESIKSITFIRKIGSNFRPNSRLFSSQPDSLSLSAKIKAEVMKFHLPILIACGVGVGCVFPDPGIFLSNLDFGGISFGPIKVYDKLSFLGVTSIFFISGLNLDSSQVNTQ